MWLHVQVVIIRSSQRVINRFWDFTPLIMIVYKSHDNEAIMSGAIMMEHFDAFILLIVSSLNELDLIYIVSII